MPKRVQEQPSGACGGEITITHGESPRDGGGHPCDFYHARVVNTRTQALRKIVDMHTPRVEDITAYCPICQTRPDCDTYTYAREALEVKP
ncbi:hypothetical protein SEA_LILBEANIE_77 [Gordonia phage Lilbeanie]|uniref:Uncharacterized protein n=1 Tax=Gordonia phage Lilbeanie TaxID=2794947 RepID=A0A7T1NXL8_9CAUD|nr:hypothetical protein J1773_gp77 [Gordonia phage Lilbeanie]QPO17155.1 hypothetical protein SEA_LILBEANIE_77 [Gordonia phage Lilbeanie]